MRVLKDYERFYEGDVEADGTEPCIEVGTIDPSFVCLYQDGGSILLTRKQAVDMIASLTRFLETPIE